MFNIDLIDVNSLIGSKNISLKIDYSIGIDQTFLN